MAKMIDQVLCKMTNLTLKMTNFLKAISLTLMALKGVSHKQKSALKKLLAGPFYSKGIKKNFSLNGPTKSFFQC